MLETVEEDPMELPAVAGRFVMLALKKQWICR